MPPVAVSGGFCGQGWWENLANLVTSKCTKGKNSFSILPAATSGELSCQLPCVPHGAGESQVKGGCCGLCLFWGHSSRRGDTVPSSLPFPTGQDRGSLIPISCLWLSLSGIYSGRARNVLLEVSLPDFHMVAPLSRWSLEAALLLREPKR